MTRTEYGRIGTRTAAALAAATLAVAGAAGCTGGSSSGPGTAGASGGESIVELMKVRDLSEADVQAALKTYTPSGRADEYYMFASGGQGGNAIVIGVPSMRILKYIGVFAPDPWQGFGFDTDTKDLLRSGQPEGKTLAWGDMHHPALSETKGDYDGEFLFVGDKANARLAVVDLKDFSTIQIERSGLIQSDHGAAFVTPNTEYVIETSQYPAPLGGKYAPIEQYAEKYRGAAIFWKFDRAKRKLVREESFAVELPPYMQDLADAGKLGSEGWAFINSFNTELSYGGLQEGKPAIESGASQNDMDYLHVIDWRKAAQVAKSGPTTTVCGVRVISLETACTQGLLHLVPEPKSPHGCDVTPDGKEIIVGGKLDTHCTVFSFEKIKGLIDAKKYVGKDRYGVPILDFKESIRGQVEIGLGPLHTVFDDQGFCYTSVFIESVVAKWSLKDLKVVDKISTHYNIGHITAAEGDTVSPDGKYIMAMNKWALDRFLPVGPLLPQNFQLIDAGGTGKMQLLYDMPIPLGEPHYAQMIKADKLHPIDIYKPTGTNAISHEKDPFAVEGGKERVERRPDGVHIFMTSIRSHFTPDIIRVKEGETLHFHITSLEQAQDATHGFAIGTYNVNLSLEPGRHCNVSFVADRAGIFPFYCTEFCSALHLEMVGYLLVEPKEQG